MLIVLACLISPAFKHCQASWCRYHGVHALSAHHSCSREGWQACLRVTGMARAAQGVVNSIVVQPVFAGERAVCYRERAAGMYAVLPFSLSLVRAQAPLLHPRFHVRFHRS